MNAETRAGADSTIEYLQQRILAIRSKPAATQLGRDAQEATVRDLHHEIDRLGGSQETRA